MGARVAGGPDRLDEPSTPAEAQVRLRPETVSSPKTDDFIGPAVSSRATADSPERARLAARSTQRRRLNAEPAPLLRVAKPRSLPPIPQESSRFSGTPPLRPYSKPSFWARGAAIREAPA